VPVVSVYEALDEENPSKVAHYLGEEKNYMKDGLDGGEGVLQYACVGELEQGGCKRGKSRKI